jgi:hypothetical protein
MNFKHKIEQQLQEVKAELKKIDQWFEYNGLADEVYFKALQRKRELLVKKQTLSDRLNSQKQSAYMPDRFEIIK